MGMYRDIRYVDLSENEDHPPIAGKLMISNQVFSGIDRFVISRSL